MNSKLPNRSDVVAGLPMMPTVSPPRLPRIIPSTVIVVLVTETRVERVVEPDVPVTVMLRVAGWEPPAIAIVAVVIVASVGTGFGAKVAVMFGPRSLALRLMAPVSPRGRLGGIQAQVFLLHGAADSVIPPSETLWLASDVPAGRLAGVLVSPAIMHVEIQGQPPLSQQWALVRFMAEVLDRAESNPSR